MNMVIARYELRRNLVVWLIFAAILTMYTAIMIAMFDPDMGKNLEALAASMPQVFEAVGMKDVGASTSLAAFLNNYLFGFIYKMFPLAFLLFLTHRIVIRYIDRGTLAIFFASDNSRGRIAGTQITMIAGYVIALVAYVAALTLILAHAMFPGALDTAAYGRLVLGLLALLFAQGGLCYLSAVWCSDATRALSIGAGLNVVFLLMQMLAQSGDKFSALRFFTPLTLFDQDALLAGRWAGWAGAGVLLALALACTGAGYARFVRRDFSL